MDLSEEVLHFIWKHRLFDQRSLTTLSGKNILIQKVGAENQHAGPDFETACISMDGIEWVGNVEIHVFSSDWNTHKHQFDKAYDNVILHVVYTYDHQVYRDDGSIPETLVLMPLIRKDMLVKYEAIMGNLNWIPCSKLIYTVPPFYIQQWLSDVLVERLMKKTKEILQLLHRYHGNWEELCYVVMARNFGFKTNADVFEMLATSIPRRLISKQGNKQLMVEALLFGQSGMLSQEEEFKEEYPALLKKEYEYLRKAYDLHHLEKTSWKFLRMRPFNFPSMRIAQFAVFCCSTNHLFTKIIETENINLYREWFVKLPVHEYWRSHYHFHKTSERTHSNQIGKKAIDNLIINTIAPILFAYGMYADHEIYRHRAVELLENIAPEQNAVIKEFDKIQVKSRHSADTQALLHLKTIYCDQKRCLKCRIGLRIITKDEKNDE